VSELERRYRRLLALFPRDHRESTGEEMLGVLMAAAGDRTRPGWRDTANLLWAAARLHLRRALAMDGTIDRRDVLAIVSLLGPIVMLAEAVPGLHELASFIQRGAVFGLPWRYQIPDAPLWVVWFAVAVFAVRRWRVAAALGAWLGTAGFVIVAKYAPYQHQWTSIDAGWVLLGFLTAVALTFSPGPERGLALVGPRRVFVLAASVAGIGLCAVLGFAGLAEQWPWLVLLSAAALKAAGDTRVGRRAALVLSVPLIPVLLWNAIGDWTYDANIAVFYGIPLLLLLVVNGLPRRPHRRLAP
jgi:hypothetical protein